ncbi:MAG: tetratricopeptide repeat protein [Fibrobacteres bacterium]|nr:tetratricopeptide repeat protein [Fibrobacterota bacterium]
MRILLIISLVAAATLSAAIGEEASNHHFKGRTVQAMRTYLAGLKSAIARADVKSEVLYLNNIAVLFSSLNETDSAKVYLDAAAKAAKLSEPFTAITALNRAFLEKKYLQIDAISLKRWEDSLSVFESAALYTAAGRMELSANKPSVAEEYFKRSIKLLSKETGSYGYADALYNLGMTHLSRKDYAKANASLEMALDIFRKSAYTAGIRKSLTALAECATTTGKTAQAEQYKMLLERLPK